MLGLITLRAELDWQRRMVEISLSGVSGGGRKRDHGSRTAAQCESDWISHRTLPCARRPSTQGLTDAVTDAGYYLRQVDDDQSVTSNHYYNFGPRQAVEWVGVEGMDPVPPGALECDRWEHGVALPTGTQGILSSTYGDFDGDGQVEVIGYEVRCAYVEGRPGFVEKTKAYVLKIHNGQLVNVGALPTSGQSIMPGFLLTDRAVSGRFPIHAPDLNGDGLPDVVWREGVFPGEVGADESKPHLRYLYALNNGAGFEVPIELPLPAEDNGAHRVSPKFLDFNADGAADIVYDDAGTLFVVLWNGQAFEESIEILDVGFVAENSHYRLQDIDGDGRHDFVYVDTQSVSVYRGVSRDFPTSVITEIENGMGVQTTIRYESLSRTQHYTQNGAGAATEVEVARFYETLNRESAEPHALHKSYPTLPLKAPVYVVTSVNSTAPAAGSVPGDIDPDAKSRISYYYSDAKVQAAGRGLLGFKTLKTVDEQTKVATVTTYRQDFPFIGYPFKTQVLTSQGHLLSESTNEWRLQDWNNGSPSAPYRPYLAKTTEETFDLLDNGLTQGAHVQTSVTTNVYDDYNHDGVSDAGQFYGNVTETSVVTTAPGLRGGHETFVNETVTAYGDTVFERQRGLVSRTVVTSSRTGWSDITRTTDFTYYTGEFGKYRGLLRAEIVEPNKPEYTLTTSYYYDRFGNKNTVTRAGLVEGGELVSRNRRVVYDATGRYVDKRYNHLNHLTIDVVERNVIGSPTMVRDFRGVQTVSSYGALGRKYRDASNTGRFRQTEFRACDAQCPRSARYVAEATESGGSRTREYMDALGRPVREETLGFDGRWSTVDTEYDRLGRVRRKSNPYFPGDTIYWSETTYDILGRIVETTVPGIAASTSTGYSRYDTIITNPHNQVKTETRNARGELIQVVDHQQGKVIYDYDAAGRLRRVSHLGSPSDPQEVVVELDYDLLGRKSYMNDPDKGQWHYKYNVFGELTEQRDAKGQIMATTYDSLGRMTRRRDVDGAGNVESDTKWTYDLAANGLGQLAVVTDEVSGYKETYTYDELGRSSTTTTCVGPNAAGLCYLRRVTYDDYNRLRQQVDSAVDGTWSNRGSEKRYNAYGYLSEIVDVDGQALVPYYKVNTMNARGRVTSFALGNGSVTNRSYEPATGRLHTLKTVSLAGGQPDIQDLRYTWDDLDNLTQRRDNRRNLTEDFLQYDGLNRLVASQVVGQAPRTVRYNSLGNITAKSNVGDYTYSGINAGPHAVTSTGDGITYQYDPNGNMYSDSSGRTLAYTVFDKPKMIAKGGYVTRFAYGPSRKRHTRVEEGVGGRTVKRYVANIEHITKPDGTREVKRYINNNVIVTTRYTADGAKTTESTDYIHHDHLGSLDVVTNEAGLIVAEMSFDAWGQRRDPTTWASLSAPALQSFASSATDRGYTAHEMLDSVGLIHMNGRVYDARLGRFLQADPFVQNAGDTQLYNRYSYLRNNPLNATDPSGYFIEALIVGAFLGYAASVAAQAYDAPWLTAVVSFIGCATLNPVACAAGFGFGSTLGAGGSFSDALINGAIAGASAYAFSFVDKQFEAASNANKASGAGIDYGTRQLTVAQTAQRVTAHAVVGGVTSELQGGEFGHGFVRAGVTAAGFAALQGTYQASKQAVVGRIERSLEESMCDAACKAFPDADDVEATVHLKEVNLGFPETELIGGAGVRVDLAGPHDAIAVLGWWKATVNVLSGKVSGDAFLQVGGRKHLTTEFLNLNTGVAELGVTLEVNSRESLSVPHFLGARSLREGVEVNIIDLQSDFIPFHP